LTCPTPASSTHGSARECLALRARRSERPWHEPLLEVQQPSPACAFRLPCLGKPSSAPAASSALCRCRTRPGSPPHRRGSSPARGTRSCRLAVSACCLACSQVPQITTQLPGPRAVHVGRSGAPFRAGGSRPVLPVRVKDLSTSALAAAWRPRKCGPRLPGPHPTAPCNPEGESALPPRRRSALSSAAGTPWSARLPGSGAHATMSPVCGALPAMPSHRWRPPRWSPM